MSETGLSEALAKLGRLSDARAERVVSLIEDLTQLELLENAEDLAIARAALAEGGGFKPWEEVKEKLDAQFGISQPVS